MRTQDPQSLDKLISDFKCSANPEVERFLKKRARDHDSKDISRTHLAISEENKLLGFITVASKCMAVEDKEELIKKAGKETYDSMNVNNDIAQAYLIGQLAKCDGAAKGFGKTMIEYALSTFTKVKKHIGCRFVRLDCYDELIPYYEGLGFRHIGKNADGTHNQMAIII